MSLDPDLAVTVADNVELEAPLAAVQARYPTTEVAPPLYLPCHFRGGGSENRWVTLYRIDD